MKFIIYGEDTYRSKKFKQSLRSRFVKKEQSDINFVEIDGEETELIALLSAATSRALLSEVRLVVVNNILKSSRGDDFEDKLLSNLSSIPDETVLVFFEEGIPRPSKIFKYLLKEKNSRRFDPLKETELVRWITEYVKEKEGEIDTKNARYLAELLSNDLWKVSNELNKILAYDSKISRENIDLLIMKPLNPSIFGLLDAVMKRRKEEAYGLLDDLLSAGEAEMAILGMITKQVRDLALVKSFSENSTIDEVAKKTKIHPYSVKKARQLALLLDKSKIAGMYLALEAADKRIKTGELSGHHALDLLISEL